MNIFRTTICFLALLMFVCAHQTHASQNGSQQQFNQQLKAALSVADKKTHGVYVIGGTLLANNVAADNIPLRSALETAGYALGACQADISKLDYKDAGEHFVINCLVREAGSALSAQGYSFDPIVTACDQLPASVKVVVAPIVTKGVQIMTHPETITIATMYMMNNVVIPYLESKK
jgi:hypothetical protein